MKKQTKLIKELTEVILNKTGANTLGHHQHLLKMLTDQHEIYSRASDDVLKNGFILTSDTDRGGTTRKKNPSLDAMNDAMKNYLLICKEFGLDPSETSISNVRASDESNIDIFDRSK